MVRFRFRLEIWFGEDALHDPATGNWSGKPHEWQYISKCNVKQNGKAKTIRTQSGEAYVYAYEVILPARTKAIPIGTRVRILDKNGVNIFDGEPMNNKSPEEAPNASYAVQGFYKSGQRFEDAKLWL